MPVRKRSTNSMALAYFDEKHLPVTIMRLFKTIGPRQTHRFGMVVPTFIRQTLTNDPVTICGNGTQKRCFAYVRDVVEALVRVMHAPNVAGEVINIGSDWEISICELAHLVKDVTGSASPILHVPYAEAYGNGFADMYRRVPCLQKLTSLIGYHPDTPLREVIEIVVASMRGCAAVGGLELQTTC